MAHAEDRTYTDPDNWSVQDEFLVSISHEVRTPLTALIGIASTLDEHVESLDPKMVKRLCKMLVGSARKLDGLLTDLIELDRLRRGIESAQRRPTNVAGLARMMAGESPLYADRRLSLELEEVVASIDAAKVERIIEHLLSNAARHTPPGTKVWLRVRRDHAGIRIDVEDAGVGIPAHLREELFTPFRHGALRDPQNPGLGIGLSLVQAFARIHEGRAWVEPRPGGGARFSVWLPDE